MCLVGRVGPGGYTNATELVPPSSPHLVKYPAWGRFTAEVRTSGRTGQLVFHPATAGLKVAYQNETVAEPIQTLSRPRAD